MDPASRTASAAVAARSSGPLTFGADWCSFAGVQGGLLVGELLDAAGAAPRSVTAHLLRPVAPGVPVHVTAAPDRSGRTGSVRTTLAQGGRTAAVAQVLTSAAPQAAGPREAVGEPADGAPFALPRELVPVADHLEIRALGRGRPLGGGSEARLVAWVRVLGASTPFTALGVLVDALPPSLFAVWTAPRPLPTVELTAHLAGPAPEPGAWVRIDQRTSWADDEYCVDDAELHAADGTLLTRARQTRRMV
ncbi:thioesterase family protein [Trujillonella humicola]|uniref:thioesterase family protein n=1 Tax=Trujillonella humicola TaxID=3383699 RepID=UPI0039057F8A